MAVKTIKLVSSSKLAEAAGVKKSDVRAAGGRLGIRPDTIRQGESYYRPDDAGKLAAELLKDWKRNIKTKGTP